MQDKLRPYLKSLLRVFECHQDYQWQVPTGGSWSQGPLFQYVAGYVTKMAEGWSDEWLDDAYNPWEMADQVTKCWRPWEPMMAAILARIPFVHSNATTLTFECPYPPNLGQDLHPKPEVLLYRSRPPAMDGMSFLSWRRRMVITGSNSTGHSAHERMQKDGLVLCGIMHCSPKKDAFFYQWLLVNSPHRFPHQLIHMDAYKVHSEMFWFCSALKLHPHVWGTDAGVQHAFRHDGHNDVFIRNLANRSLFQKLL